jgi:hypothetical protein
MSIQTNIVSIPEQMIINPIGEIKEEGNIEIESIRQPEETFIMGKFLYINDLETRKILVYAWEAITALELWNFMKEDTHSYMFNNEPNVRRIYCKIEQLGYYGHSGASFGWTMRQMQYIAKHGETKYRSDVLNYK